MANQALASNMSDCIGKCEWFGKIRKYNLLNWVNSKALKIQLTLLEHCTSWNHDIDLPMGEIRYSSKGIIKLIQVTIEFTALIHRFRGIDL